VIATYRLQLGPHLSFAEAEGLVPYLADLGVSHLYLSPCFESRPGSEHGYDVVDPSRISEERGGEEAFRRLCAAGLEVILDIVPNHMAVAGENPYWADPERRRRFFDVDETTGRHRRFFDVDELAGVRVEDPHVFDVTHRLALELVRAGLVGGLRVDHVDGLADPRGYLERLRVAGAPHVWVEKVLEDGERLREWPVEGTTGYDFLNDAQRLLVDPDGEDALTSLYVELTGEDDGFADIAHGAKLEQARTTFRPEVERLRHLWDAPGLEEALASLPVYRTYVEPSSGDVEDADRLALDRAGLPRELRAVLELERPGHDEFVVRFQQTTGAVMAKGVEDTAFYRYGRLLCLNEVGGDPSLFHLDVEEFHRRNTIRAERFPRTLLAGSTHDTKRSADVRARIAALTTLSDDWAGSVRRWLAKTESLLTGDAPDRNERYFLFQTLVGAWPLTLDRLQAHAIKALREAKRNTSWVDQDEEWESAVTRYCAALLGHAELRADLESFVDRVIPAGERIALAEVLLRLTCPGVPDVYQGDELELLALVDPDNRRRVDWARRRRLLADVKAGVPPTRETAKLHLLTRALRVRAARPEAFEGAYTPLAAGRGACCFRRGDDVQVWVPLRGRTSKPAPPPGFTDILPEYELGLYVT
jgi:(1->4)-alpha-D-glucan 1-alpha-D-glucosylmutase